MFRCVVTFDRSADMAVFGFGRRRTPEPDKHIVPPELWNDPKGAAFFARIGAKPDDPDNLRVSHDEVRRMMDEGRKAVEERVRQVQARALAEGHGDIRVRPFWLIQDNCWNAEVGDFLLYTLRLNPYEEWNTLILPVDERGASILNLPLHPGGNIPHLEEAGRAIILALRDKLSAAYEEAKRTHEFGRVADAHDDTVAKVKKLAQTFHEGLVEMYQAMLRDRAGGRPTPR
jgi:uncharacterized protein YneF (UPF0154 family)